VPIAEPLQGGPSFSASETGVLVLRRGRGAQAQLTWFDREGKQMSAAGDPGGISSPTMSPDQKSVAFYQSDGMSLGIWLFDIERSNSTLFTPGPDASYFPVWSPDGSRIAYAVRRSGERLLVERPASGIGKETVLYRATGTYYIPQNWSRDGRWLILAELPASDAFYLLPMGPEGSRGERKLVPFPVKLSDGRNPSLSPDGQWLLYSSTHTGSREVFVQSMPEALGGSSAGAKKQVSIGGGA
jgi:Tol biopolymer transport system component